LALGRDSLESRPPSGDQIHNQKETPSTCTIGIFSSEPWYLFVGILKNGLKRNYSAKYALSGIVFCGECGEIYRRIHWNNRGKKSIVWRCVNRLEEKGSSCTSRTITEEDLQAGVVKAINQIILERDGFRSILAKNIEAVIGAEFDMDTYDIDAKLGTLQDEILRLASSSSNYDFLAAEIHRLRSIKMETQEHNALRQTKRQRVAEMAEFLEMQSGMISEYNDKLTRQLVERIMLFENRLLVTFKSEVEIDVEN